MTTLSSSLVTTRHSQSQKLAKVRSTIPSDRVPSLGGIPASVWYDRGLQARVLVDPSAASRATVYDVGQGSVAFLVDEWVEETKTWLTGTDTSSIDQGNDTSESWSTG